ncbi:hypothetical protein C6497_10440 [Candidatus Poribacteria bacterium]|nr:MAG: hypothetical protein C6497_10440 [Candidatus Poribacteria bacterium]
MTIQYIKNNLKNNNSITYTISDKKWYMKDLLSCHLIGYTLNDHHTIMRHHLLENVLQMSVSDIPPKNIKKKKEERHRNHNLRNFTIVKKTPINADCDRADSRFTNDTQCVKKCNIFNIMNNNYYICDN